MPAVSEPSSSLPILVAKVYVPSQCVPSIIHRLPRRPFAEVLGKLPFLIARLRGLEDAHLLPLLPKRADTNNRARLALDILDLQELVLLAECEEVREERVEVALAAQVQDLLVVRVVEVREDAEELAVDVLDCRGEVLREVAAWKRGR